MSQLDCPTQAELSRFALGDLPRLVLARLAEHVEHCPACETALGAVDGQGDTLLRQLRLADGPAEKLAVDEPPGPLLEAARVAGHDAVVGSIAPGKFADLLVLDRDLHVQVVFVAGEEISVTEDIG